MTRLFLFIAAGAIFGLMTHVVTLLAVPLNAGRDAYARIIEVAETGRFVDVGAEPDQGGLPSLDPTFLHGACPYDLAFGPVSVRVPEFPGYFTVTFHDRMARPFFVINDRVTIGGAVEAFLVDPQTPVVVPPTGTRVDTTEPVGFVLIRAAVTNPSERTRVREIMAEATCQTVLLAN